MPNPYVVSLDREEVRYKTYYRRGSGTAQHHRTPRPREGHRRVYVPRREEVVETPAQHGMLPAIYFVFSRAGCDRSVEWLMGSGIRLTSQDEAERIRDFTEMRAADGRGRPADARVLRLRRGARGRDLGPPRRDAAGLRETVEELFEAGLVKIVFATETLSLASTCPPRSVVIEDLWKFQGERHEILTPGEYTQLTGRAGRRGSTTSDTPSWCTSARCRSSASRRWPRRARTSSPPRSASYNMAVNLVRNYTREQAHHLLNSSFAQFLADRGWSLDRELERSAEALEGYRRQMHCHLGDFREYWRLREKATSVREEARKGRERPGRTRSGRRCRRFVPGRHLRPAGQTPRARGGPVGPRGRPTVLAQDRKYSACRRATSRTRPSP